MTWVRLDDAFPDHPKVVVALSAVGPAGMWFHVTAICWCAKHLTDGKIPEAKVSTFVEGLDGLAMANELVKAKLWKKIRTGFVIHDFLVYHPSKERVEERREEAAKRKRESRARHTVTAQNVTRDNHVTLTGVQPRAGSGREEGVGETLQGTAGLDAIAEVMRILSSVPSWEFIEPVGIENVAAMYPTEDLIAGARLAAVWGASPDWKMAPAASLRSAMQKRHAEQPAGRSKAERSRDDLAAIEQLMGGAA